MKKFLLIFFISLASIVTLSVVAFAAVCISVADETDNTPDNIRTADVDLEQFINREAVKALDGVGEKDEVSLLFDEYAMNELVYAIAREVKLPMVEVVGAYVTYAENGALKAEVPLKFSGFVSTCLKAGIKISFENGVFTVTLEDAYVGNFALTDGAIRVFVLNDFNGRNWQKDLEKAGICGTLDLNDLSFSMTVNEICDTIANLTEKDPNGKLYRLVCDLALKSEDLIDFYFGEGGYYGVTLNTGKLAYDQVTDGAISHPLDLDSAAESTRYWLDKGVTPKNVSSVFHYYVSGYDALSDKEKADVNALGLTENGMGVRTVSPASMAQVFADQTGGLAASLINRRVTLTVSDEQMNTILACLDVIGAGTAFCHGDKLAYLTLESIDIFLDDHNFRLLLTFNLNGKRLCGYIDADCPDTDRMAIYAHITQIRIGKLALTNEHVSTFLSYLNDILSAENWIYADDAENIVTLDMEQAIAESGGYGIMFARDPSVSMRCRKLSGKGQLQMVFETH